MSSGAIEATSVAFQSDLGEAVLRDLHARARLLHLPSQSLHLGNREARIMGDNDDRGGFEDLAKGADEFAFCRAIQVLSPVGGHAARYPAHRHSLCGLFRAVEVRTEGLHHSSQCGKNGGGPGLHPSMQVLAT